MVPKAVMVSSMLASLDRSLPRLGRPRVTALLLPRPLRGSSKAISSKAETSHHDINIPIHRGSTIEVESKFNPASESLAQLRSNSGSPRFETLKRKVDRSFYDEYFDTVDKLLEGQGIWVRKRDNTWEAKCRRMGDFRDSAFVELSGGVAVEGLVRQVLNGSGCDGGDFEGWRPGNGFLEEALRVSAAFTTIREEWLANGRFYVVIDETDFGHRVGEVEVAQEYFDIRPQGLSKAEKTEGRGNRGQTTKDERERMQMSRLREELDAFMSKYRWAFPIKRDEEVVGKLSAYHARHG